MEEAAEDATTTVSQPPLSSATNTRVSQPPLSSAHHTPVSQPPLSSADETPVSLPQQSSADNLSISATTEQCSTPRQELQPPLKSPDETMLSLPPQSSDKPAVPSNNEVLPKFSSPAAEAKSQDLSNGTTTSDGVSKDDTTVKNVHDPPSENSDPPKDDDEKSTKVMRQDDIDDLHKKKTIMSGTGNLFSSENILEQSAPAVDIMAAAPGLTPPVANPLPRVSPLSQQARRGSRAGRPLVPHQVP